MKVVTGEMRVAVAQSTRQELAQTSTRGKLSPNSIVSVDPLHIEKHSDRQAARNNAGIVESRIVSLDLDSVHRAGKLFAEVAYL